MSRDRTDQPSAGPIPAATGAAAALAAGVLLSAALAHPDAGAQDPPDVRPNVVISGSDEAKQTFNNILDKCKNESDQVQNLLNQLDEIDVKVEFKVGSGQEGVIVDHFQPIRDGSGDVTGIDGRVDVGDIAQFPNPEKNQETGEFVFPEGVPDWAVTKCEVLAHFLAERLDAAQDLDQGNYSDGKQFGKSHPEGVDAQNEVREKTFGQDDDVKSQEAKQTDDDPQPEGVIEIDGKSQVIQIDENGDITGFEYNP